MTRKQKHIRQFLILISSAVCFAFAIVGTLLYVYGPTGMYKIENVLLSPDLIQTLSYSDQGVRQERVAYKFYDIQWNSRKNAKWEKRSIPLSTYNTLYAALKDSESVKREESLESKFDAYPVSNLILLMKSHSTIPDLTESMKVFQEVQFIEEEGIFRVQVFQANSSIEWAYFRSPLLKTYLEELGSYEE